MTRRIRTTTVQALMTRPLATKGHPHGPYASRRTGAYQFDLVMPGAPRVHVLTLIGETRVNFIPQSIRRFIEREARAS